MVPQHGGVLHAAADVCVLLLLATIGSAALPVQIRADVERGSPLVRYERAEPFAKIVIGVCI